jgi:hypothetical protein
LPDTYNEFFAKYESIVFISFGTMFVPSFDQMMQIVKMIKMSDSQTQGFIISLQKYADSYEDIASQNIENLLLSSWVP